jgi:hypothetical protein
MTVTSGVIPELNVILGQPAVRSHLEAGSTRGLRLCHLGSSVAIAAAWIPWSHAA